MPDTLLIEPGIVPYRTALGLQEAWARARAAGSVPDALILLEHPPVYTLGSSARAEEFRVPREHLEADGAEVVATHRGGAITYHGPGQLVGYPILDLAARGHDVHRYLRDLEEVLIRTLADFGVRGARMAGATGVWVDGAKIASIGVGVRRWVSLHGFALNVTRELEPFAAIVPCGLAGVRMTCLAACARWDVSMADVRERVTRRFGEVFERTLLPESLEGMSARLGAVSDSPQSAQRSQREAMRLTGIGKGSPFSKGDVVFGSAVGQESIPSVSAVSAISAVKSFR